MELNCNTGGVVSGSDDVGNAVGVSDRLWFVACMRRNNIETSTAERLLTRGYECYVATQDEVRVWRNGRKRKVKRVVIPSVVFIHCTEAERREVVYDPSIARFMTDKVGVNVIRGKIAVIPQKQMERLQFMLGQSDVPVEFVPDRYRPGDKVRVIRGSLRGLEGEVINAADGKSDLIVSVDVLGNAKLSVNTVDLELIG